MSVTRSLVHQRAAQRPRIAPSLAQGGSLGRHGGCHRRAVFSKGSGEGGSYTGAFPGFPSVSADFHQPPLRALSIPGAWVLRSPDLVVVSSFRMHCTFPIWTYRWCVAFNFDPRVLGIQPCHPSGSKPAAHFFRTEVRTRDLQVAMTSRYAKKSNCRASYQLEHCTQCQCRPVLTISATLRDQCNFYHGTQCSVQASAEVVGRITWQKQGLFASS